MTSQRHEDILQPSLRAGIRIVLRWLKDPFHALGVPPHHRPPPYSTCLMLYFWP